MVLSHGHSACSQDEETAALSSRVRELESQLEEGTKGEAAFKEVTHLQQELAMAVVKMGKLDAENQELRAEVKQLQLEERERRDRATKELRDELARKNEAVLGLREESRKQRAESERLADKVTQLTAALERERARSAAKERER